MQVIHTHTHTHTHIYIYIIYIIYIYIHLATTVIKLQHSLRNYTHLRFSQRYEISSSNATPCSLVGMSRRSEWPYRLRQNPPKRRYASTALVRPYIPTDRNLRIGSNHTTRLCFLLLNTEQFVFKKKKVKIYKSIILPVLPGRGTLFLTLTLTNTH